MGPNSSEVTFHCVVTYSSPYFPSGRLVLDHQMEHRANCKLKHTVYQVSEVCGLHALLPFETVRLLRGPTAFKLTVQRCLKPGASRILLILSERYMSRCISRYPENIPECSKCVYLHGKYCCAASSCGGRCWSFVHRGEDIVLRWLQHREPRQEAAWSAGLRSRILNFVGDLFQDCAGCRFWQDEVAASL